MTDATGGIGYEYRCPACGARVSSGWAYPICPMPNCGEVLQLLSGPEPTEADLHALDAELARMLDPDGPIPGLA